MNASEPIVLRPRNLAELDDAVEHAPGSVTYVAGATDLMVHPEHWQASRVLVDLNTVSEIAGTLRLDGDAVLIGAAVPLSLLIRHTEVAKTYPLLAEACRQIGSVQIQNRATLGGNIANASPAGDSLPVLNVYDAELWLGPRINGEFVRVPVADIMRGPGQTALAGKYIAYVRLPRLAGRAFGYFRKVGQRYSLAISKLSLAVLVEGDANHIRDIRICAGSVSAVVKRAERTEALLRGHALNEDLITRASLELAEEVTPISDIRSTVAYRRQICGAVLSGALHQWQWGLESAT